MKDEFCSFEDILSLCYDKYKHAMTWDSAEEGNEYGLRVGKPGKELIISVDHCWKSPHKGEIFVNGRPQAFYLEHLKNPKIDGIPWKYSVGRFVLPRRLKKLLDGTPEWAGSCHGVITPGQSRIDMCKFCTSDNCKVANKSEGKGNFPDDCPMIPATKRIFTEMTDCAERSAFKEFSSRTSLYGEPYVMHLMRVAEYTEGIDRDEDAVAAAFLHDVLEDLPGHPEDIDENANQYLPEEVYSRRVIDAVKQVTFVKPDSYKKLSYPEKERLYLDHIRKIADSKNRLAIDVKTADLYDHIYAKIPEEEINKLSTFSRRNKYELALRILCGNISK